MTVQQIVFVAPFGLGKKTTVWARTLPLARYLASQGQQVTILIPPWDTPVDAGKQWVEDGVQMVNVHLGGGILGTVARMVHWIDRAQPQIVHIVKPRAHAGLVQWWLWQKRRLQRRGPHLLLDVDDWEQAWNAINHYPRPVARFLAWQEEWGIRHADAVTAASGWLVDRVQQYTPHTPVLYLPNGIERVPTTENGPQATSDEICVLFFSRFVEVEPAWLADFWHALHEQLPQARLLIAGQALQSGREAIYQTQMQKTNPVGAAQVEWLGYVQPADLPALYARSTCAIFPSAATPLLQAKCSVKLATTLLHRVPVIASAVGEQAAYGANGAAYLVAADATAAAFAHATAELVNQPLRQQQLINDAKQHLLSTYPWPRLGKDLVAFYQQVNQPKPARNQTN